MSEEIVMRWGSLYAAFERRLATGTRDALPVMVEVARGIVRKIIEVTPPGHDSVKGATREALEHGQARVAGDIRRLYGTPSDAYEAIRGKSPAAASAFWHLRKRDRQAAAQLAREQLGVWYGPFDGGAIHSSHFVRGRIRDRQRKNAPVIYVDDERELEAYIKEQQGHVMFLTAGWKEACAKLGISLPGFVSKNSAPSHAVIEVTSDRLRIVASNDVEYASDADLQRRVQFAIDSQTASMQRQWEDYVSSRPYLEGLGA